MTTPTFPATVSVDHRTFDEGAVTLTPNWSGMEVEVRGWSTTAARSQDLVAEIRLSPRQALRLAALLKDLAQEVRGVTAWTTDTAEFIGWYPSREYVSSDLVDMPVDDAVIIEASRAEVTEAIDSLRAEGWSPVPGRWQGRVWGRIEELALLGD
jgi:hypothetical protein